eukprot:s7487_g2.t1
MAMKQVRGGESPQTWTSRQRMQALLLQVQEEHDRVPDRISTLPEGGLGVGAESSAISRLWHCSWTCADAEHVTSPSSPETGSAGNAKTLRRSNAWFCSNRTAINA